MVKHKLPLVIFLKAKRSGVFLNNLIGKEDVTNYA